MSATTEILPCKCEHPFQDAQYGHGKRVHNWARKAGPSGGWRCTVCSNVKQGAKPAEVK